MTTPSPSTTHLPTNISGQLSADLDLDPPPPGGGVPPRPETGSTVILDPETLDAAGRCRLHHNRPTDGCWTCDQLADVTQREHR